MNYKLSNKAESDLRGIYRYTEVNFGSNQAAAYLTGLEEVILQVANTPTIAQNVDDIRLKYRRYLLQQHTIYFLEETSYIYIVRILHQQMKASLHLD